MEFQHTGRDFELTDAIRAYAEDKLGKACVQIERYGATTLHVTYEREGHAHHGLNQVVHAVLFVPNHEPLTVRDQEPDLYAAIDRAAKQLERQVHRYCQKHQGAERARQAKGRSEA